MTVVIRRSSSRNRTQKWRCEPAASGLDLARAADWPAGHATSLVNLGNIARDMGHLDTAIEHQTNALGLFSETDESRGRPALWGIWGTSTGNGARSTWPLGTRTRPCRRQLGNRIGEANSLDNLGEIATARGQLGQADECLTQALTLHREVGDRYGEAYCLGCLAALRLHTGRLGQALELAGTALDVANKIGDPRTRAETHNTLGLIDQHHGDVHKADRHHRRALRLAREAGTRYAETSASPPPAARTRSGSEPCSLRPGEHHANLDETHPAR